MPTYTIMEDSATGVELRGGALQLWKCTGGEVMLAGPAETGKTFGALTKLDALMWKYPDARALMLRKTYSAVKTSAVITFEDKVLQAYDTSKGEFASTLTAVRKVGGDNVSFYEYPNGSRIYVGGMDQAAAGDRYGSKVLSAEYDIIYVNQAEELTLDDWEKLISRCTGRAGNTRYPQLMGDCNPGPPTHWIQERRKQGSLTFFNSSHKDNPTLYDEDLGAWTEQGERTRKRLSSLTGMRYKRLWLGLWVQAEGTVYEDFDYGVHVLKAKPRIPKSWDRFRVHDFGHRDPHVTQWWAISPATRQLIMYREIYMSGKTIAELAPQIKALSYGENIVADICDHDVERRIALEKHLGIRTIAAYKDRHAGINAVQERLKHDWTVDARGKPIPGIVFSPETLVEEDRELKLLYKPTRTVDEFPSYVYLDREREQTSKTDDHGLDDVRYLVAEVDNLRRRAKHGARNARSVLRKGEKPPYTYQPQPHLYHDGSGPVVPSPGPNANRSPGVGTRRRRRRRRRRP